MKRHIIYIAAAFTCALALYSCSDDSGKPGDGDTDEGSPRTVETVGGTATILDAKLNVSAAATYQWSVVNPQTETYSLCGATTPKVTFLSTTAGTYHLQLVAREAAQAKSTGNSGTLVRNYTVIVSQPAKELSPYIAAIADFLPAPGQFTNSIPEYEPGDTKAAIIEKVAGYLVGKKNGGLVSLGGFGGYIILGFDHTIVNVKGRRDFRIMGNAFYSSTKPNADGHMGGSCEPGIVMVAYDSNANGKPDDNEWYEIAGSEYTKATTTKQYEMTYFRPVTEENDGSGSGSISIKDYIRWTDNQGGSGYVSKNTFHKQSYYPGWISDNSITYRGTLLPDNAVDQSGNGSNWVLYAYGHGYADNALNSEDDSAIDISWAVDTAGKRVELPGVDFVKIITGVSQDAGWLGEVSTDVTGVYDLHLAGEVINSL